jgi:CheY-like chemotaxis protein
MAENTILIVEDNPVNALILRSLLRKRGYDPLVAQDGMEGVTMAEQHRPRLVLMDLNMPRMDGFQAAAEIRKRLEGDEVTIVAVTANVTDSQQDACAAAGFAGLLAKPLDFEELIATVRRWIPAA